MELKKAKHSLAVRKQEIDHLEAALEIAKMESESKSTELMEKKASLEKELAELEEHYKVLISREKKNLKDNNKAEINALEVTHCNHS